MTVPVFRRTFFGGSRLQTIPLTTESALDFRKTAWSLLNGKKEWGISSDLRKVLLKEEQNGAIDLHVEVGHHRLTWIQSVSVDSEMRVTTKGYSFHFFGSALWGLRKYLGVSTSLYSPQVINDLLTEIGHFIENHGPELQSQLLLKGGIGLTWDQMELDTNILCEFYRPTDFPQALMPLPLELLSLFEKATGVETLTAK